MRLVYYPTSYNDYLNYYANQVGKGGRNINVYRGTAIQRGNGIGSIFQSLIKFITPLFKSDAVKSAGRAILQRGINVGSEVLGGKSLGSAVKEQTGQALESLLSGSGRRRRKCKTPATRKQTTKRKRRKTKKRKSSVTAGRRRRGKQNKTKTAKKPRKTTGRRKTTKRKKSAYQPSVRLSSFFD
jgi:hypothetical protein